MLIIFIKGILWKGKERGCKALNSWLIAVLSSHCVLSDAKVLSISGCNVIIIIALK